MSKKNKNRNQAREQKPTTTTDAAPPEVDTNPEDVRVPVAIEGMGSQVVERGHVRLPAVEATDGMGSQMLGPGEPVAPAIEDLRNAVLTGKLTALEAAKIHWQLEDHHILASRDFDGGVSIVTGGGQRVEWPRDEARELTAMEKGDDVRKTTGPAGVKRFEKH